MVDLKEIYVQVNNLERSKRLIPPSLEHHQYLWMFNFLFSAFSLFLSHTSNIFPLHTHIFCFIFRYMSPSLSLELLALQKVVFFWLMRVKGNISHHSTNHNEWMTSHPMKVHNYACLSSSSWSTSPRFWMKRPHHNWSEGFLLFSP